MTPPARPVRPARYALISRPEVSADMLALAVHGPEIVTATAALLDDLTHGRVTGKPLGDRQISGDLTGLARIKFDLPGQRPHRYRLLYRQLPNTTTLEIIAIGPRRQHAINQLAVSRLMPEHPI